MSGRRRALFLDRDGVINLDSGYVHTPRETLWVPGIFDLCRKAVGHGFALVVVTNQAGIARGYYSEQDFLSHARWMRGEFADRGVTLAAIYHCPHHPTEGQGALRVACDCRKPSPGMLLQAQREMDLDLSGSALVGDKASDIAAATRAGVGRSLRIGTDGKAGAGLPGMQGAIAWIDTLSPVQHGEIE